MAKKSDEQMETEAFLQTATDVRRQAEPAIEAANKFKAAASEVKDDSVKKELLRRADVRFRHAVPRLKVAEFLESYARKGGERA